MWAKIQIVLPITPPIHTEPVVGFLQTLYVVEEGAGVVSLDIVVSPPAGIPLLIMLRLVPETAQSEKHPIFPLNSF